MYNKHNENENNSNNTICSIACSTFSSVILLVSSIAYLIFAIVFLIQDYDIANDCNKSNLWIYVLVSIILSFTNVNIKLSEDDSQMKWYTLIVAIFIINVSMSLWGSIELWVNNCDNLESTGLWKIGIVSFVLQLFVSCVCLIIPCILSYILHTVNNETLTINTDV
jgi:hypothetical protein